jgi:hypothetical protein
MEIKEIFRRMVYQIPKPLPAYPLPVQIIYRQEAEEIRGKRVGNQKSVGRTEPWHE